MDQHRIIKSKESCEEDRLENFQVAGYTKPREGIRTVWGVQLRALDSIDAQSFPKHNITLAHVNFSLTYPRKSGGAYSPNPVDDLLYRSLT